MSRSAAPSGQRTDSSQVANLKVPDEGSSWVCVTVLEGFQRCDASLAFVKPLNCIVNLGIMIKIGPSASLTLIINMHKRQKANTNLPLDTYSSFAHANYLHLHTHMKTQRFPH